MSPAKKKKKSSARLEGIVSKLTSVATESQQEKGDATPTKKMPFVKKMPLVKYSVTDQSKQKGDANTNKKKMPVVKKKMPPLKSSMTNQSQQKRYANSIKKKSKDKKVCFETSNLI